MTTLLRIPPVLIGVNSLDDLLSGMLDEPTTHPAAASPPPVVPKPEETAPSDIMLYQEYLKHCWEQNRTSSLHPHAGDSDLIIAQLEKEVLYGSSSQKVQAVTLLCGYHMLSANVANDDGKSESAITSLNKAYTLAKSHDLFELQVGILCRRGWVLKERGEESWGLRFFAPAQEDFVLAKRDFTTARSLIKTYHLPPSLYGSLLMSLGQLQASVARTPWELHQAMKNIAEVEPYIDQESDKEDIHFVGINEERYHLDRAAAYIASPVQSACFAKDARRELRNAIAAQGTPQPKRRLAYNLILQAKSYTIEGDKYADSHKTGDAEDSYMQATSKATESIGIVKRIHSRLNIGRLDGICETLKQTTYGKTSFDVATLEVEVMAAKYPDLFA